MASWWLMLIYFAIFTLHCVHPVCIYDIVWLAMLSAACLPRNFGLSFLLLLTANYIIMHSNWWKIYLNWNWSADSLPPTQIKWVINNKHNIDINSVLILHLTWEFSHKWWSDVTNLYVCDVTYSSCIVCAHMCCTQYPWLEILLWESRLWDDRFGVQLYCELTHEPAWPWLSWLQLIRMFLSLCRPLIRQALAYIGRNSLWWWWVSGRSSTFHVSVQEKTDSSN